MRNAIKLNIVRDGGEASKAGLHVGDLLISYGEFDLLSPEDLTVAIGKNNGKSDVVFVRNGSLMTASVLAGALDVSFGEVSIELPNNIPKSIEKPVPQHEIDRSIEIATAGMIVSTAPSIDGYRATKQLGVISAECVFGMNAFKDFFAGMSDFFGGRSGTTQSALREARETCIKELKKEAAMLGANAIIAVDLDYSEFSGQGKSMLFLVATGTAVCIEQVQQ